MSHRDDHFIIRPTSVDYIVDRPPKPTGDLTELRAIHCHLFQDLHDRAGQVRTVDIRKNVEGAGFFLPSGMIERASAFAAGELHADNTLRGLDRAHFIDRPTNAPVPGFRS